MTWSYVTRKPRNFHQQLKPTGGLVGGALPGRWYEFSSWHRGILGAYYGWSGGKAPFWKGSKIFFFEDFVVCCLLFVVCCLLFVVVVCCLLFVVCLLFVCCLLLLLLLCCCCCCGCCCRRSRSRCGCRCSCFFWSVVVAVAVLVLMLMLMYVDVTSTHTHTCERHDCWQRWNRSCDSAETKDQRNVPESLGNLSFTELPEDMMAMNCWILLDMLNDYVYSLTIFDSWLNHS